MDREPDVEMGAAVKAGEVRFERKPEVRVVAYADSPASAESRSERDNLPDELDSGVSYRNFAVRWRAAVWLQDDWGEDTVRPDEGDDGSPIDDPKPRT